MNCCANNCFSFLLYLVANTHYEGEHYWNQQQYEWI